MKITINKYGFINKIESLNVSWNHTEEHNLIQRGVERCGLDVHNINLKFLKHFLKHNSLYKSNTKYIVYFKFSEYSFLITHIKETDTILVLTFFNSEMTEKAKNRLDSKFILITD